MATGKKKEPAIVLANVREVTLTDDGNGALVPLIPAGDVWFEATVIYDLLRAGVSWKTIRERYRLARRNSRRTIVDYVRRHGRRVYDDLTRAPMWVTYTTVAVEMPDGL